MKIFSSGKLKHSPSDNFLKPDVIEFYLIFMVVFGSVLVNIVILLATVRHVVPLTLNEEYHLSLRNCEYSKI